MTVFHIMREEKATWSSQFVLLFVPVEVLEKAICVCIVHTHGGLPRSSNVFLKGFSEEGSDVGL